jgi:hypothetical protein
MDASWVDVIIHLINAIVAPITQAIVYIGITIGIGKLSKKWGIEREKLQLSYLQEIGRSAVAATEEWAVDNLKNNGGKIPSKDKLKNAVKIILSKVPDYSEDKAIELIQSILGKTEGIGATGAKKI